MPIVITLSSDEMDQEALYDLTQELHSNLIAEANLEATLAKPITQVGGKGAIPTEVWVAAGAGGTITATALVRVLVAIARRTRVKFSVKNSAGTEVYIDASNIRAKDLPSITNAITEICKHDFKQS